MQGIKTNKQHKTMSEKNNQPKHTPQAEKEKRQQRKPWHRNGQHGKAKKKDPKAIPEPSNLAQGTSLPSSKKPFPRLQ
jgi:hypothetical protein